MSNNIDFRLKNIYDKGYNDAIEQCNLFLNAINNKFSDLPLGKLEKNLTLGTFINIVSNEIYGFKKQLPIKGNKHV